MKTAHLTSLTKHKTGWKADCLCGWSHLVTRGDIGPSTPLKKRAKELAWQHWASSPVGVDEGSA